MSNSTDTASHAASTTGKKTSLLHAIDELLTGGANAWHLSRQATSAILFAPIVVAASGIAAAFVGKSFYKWYTEEDGFAETMQVFFYGSAWIMCLLVARYQIRARNVLIAALYLILAGGLFFLVGEEVSWGQRIFGWATPDSMSAINKQEETNLHNIYGVGHSFKWIQMLVGAYGAILPLVLLRVRVPTGFQEVTNAVVPHYTLILYFLPMFAWRLYRNLSGDPVRYYYLITNYNEIVELILAMGFCFFMVFQLRKCLRDSGHTVKS